MSGLEIVFPGLRDTPYQITSPADDSYNCIAWAAADTAHWWWPGNPDRTVWPDGVPRSLTLDAFKQAFATLGYEPSDSEEAEPGVDKIAVFASAERIPRHAARQLTTGRWTSKLGQNVDIEHELHAIAGEPYGTVALIMKRSRT